MALITPLITMILLLLMIEFCLRNKKIGRHNLIFLLCLFYFSISSGDDGLYAQGNLNDDSIDLYENTQSKLEIGTEYFVPTKSSNQITTITANGFYWRRYFKEAGFLISAGITTNYAWGHSGQWQQVSSAIASVEYKSSAFGIGPVFQVAPTIIKVKQFSLIAEANGGVMIYDKHFPYGGDFYNFIFRTGPSIAYRFKSRYSLKIGYRWMHVSNGQGLGNQNPFYEAQGFNLSILVYN